MAGLLDTLKEKAKQVYGQGLLNQVITNPASVGQELSQLFDPNYMRNIKPISQEAALDVALSAPMGILSTKVINPEYIYHGTSPSAAKSIEKAGFDLTKSADGSIWFTSNPNIGDVAASAKGGIVKRILPKNLKLGGWDETDKYSTDELIQMGYDGLKLVDDGDITYQIFNPQKLKK